MKPPISFITAAILIIAIGAVLSIDGVSPEDQQKQVEAERIERAECIAQGKLMRTYCISVYDFCREATKDMFAGLDFSQTNNADTISKSMNEHMRQCIQINTPKK